MSQYLRIFSELWSWRRLPSGQVRFRDSAGRAYQLVEAPNCDAGEFHLVDEETGFVVNDVCISRSGRGFSAAHFSA